LTTFGHIYYTLLMNTAPSIQPTKSNLPMIIGAVILAIIIIGSIFAFASKPNNDTDSQSKPATEKMLDSGVNKSPKEAILPANFPKDIPVFPGAKITDTTDLTTSFALTYSVDKSKGSTKQVIDFYTTEMTKQGFKFTEAPILNETTGNYITGAKNGSKEFRVITYPLTDNPNITSINLNLSGYPR
jgi:hypothetical protein